MADKKINLIYKILGIDKATQKTRKLDSSLEKLGKRAGQVAKGFIGFEVARRGIQLAKTASQAEIVARSFRKLADEPDKMLQAMKVATAGTISEMELMQKFNQASLLGLPLDRFDDMLTIARGSAQATGESMDFMLNSIVTGLGRGSKLMLDNLGIILDVKKANEEYAVALNKTASELTDNERKQAFVNKALEIGIGNLERAGGVTESNADMFDQASSALGDFGIEAGQLLTRHITPLIKGFTNLTTDVTNFLKAIEPEGFAEGRLGELQRELEALEDQQKTSANTAFVFSTAMIASNASQADSLERLIEAKKAEIEAEEIRVEQAQILQDAQTDPIVSQLRETNIEQTFRMKNAEEILAERRKEINREEVANFTRVIGMADVFTQRLVQASIEGQNMGQIVKSAVNSIAVEIASKMALFGLLRMAGTFLNPASAGAVAIGQATGGGLGSFLLQGFTGQTSKVNQTININGGLVSQSYVKNTLLPAINNARAIG